MLRIYIFNHGRTLSLPLETTLTPGFWIPFARISPTNETIFELFLSKRSWQFFWDCLWKWTSAQAFFSIILFFTPSQARQKSKRKMREKLFGRFFYGESGGDEERIFSQMVAEGRWPGRWNVEDVERARLMNTNTNFISPTSKTTKTE